MNSKEIYEKISKRNKYVATCSTMRNDSYSAYMKESMLYDNLKKGFYLALELSRHDNNTADERKINRS